MREETPETAAPIRAAVSRTTNQGQFARLEDVLHYYSTLEDAVQLDHHQEQILAPLNLTVGQMTDLHAFLEALTDVSLDESLLTPPPGPSLTDR